MRQPDDVGWQFLMNGHRGYSLWERAATRAASSDWTTGNRPPAPPLVNAPDREVSGAGQFLGDRLDQAGIHRLDRGREYGGDTAVAADQIFMEVPAWYLKRALGGGPFVEWMQVGAAHLGLGGEWKAHAVFIVRGVHDVDWCAGLLAAEIVRGHADDFQPLAVVARVELLQAGELRRVAALRGGIDDEHRLASVVDKPNVAAAKGGEREHIGGDPAHGRRLCK